MDSAQTVNKALQPGPAFAVVFILCVIPVAALMSHIQDTYWIAWRDATMLASAKLGTFFGLDITRNADILSVNGFAMRIIPQCTAVDYLAILATAIMVYVRHSLSYRLLGIAIAVPAVIFANACRLIISGVVGTFSRSAFDFAHDYLWVIGFALIVFAIWTFWVNGHLLISRSAAGRLALIASVSIATYALLSAFSDPFGQMMSYASSCIYKLLYSNPGVAIDWNGSETVCSYAGNSFYFRNLSEQLNVAVYIGLMVPLQRKRDWEMLATTILGLIFIIVIGAIFTAVGCNNGVVSGEQSLESFVKIGSVIHLALPMAIYWIMASEREGGKAAKRS